jgi:hypothetical protein
MIRRFKFRRRRAVALALSACALTVTAPTAVAATWEDMDSSGGRGATQGAEQQAVGYGDLRSPDARDAAQGAEQRTQSATAARDLRSPDARDAANGVTTRAQPTPRTAPVEARTVISVEEAGSSQTLPIVLSGGALLIALLAVALVAGGRSSRPRWSAP